MRDGTEKQGIMGGIFLEVIVVVLLPLWKLWGLDKCMQTDFIPCKIID
jgi:hypothetical protein